MLAENGARAPSPSTARRKNPPSAVFRNSQPMTAPPVRVSQSMIATRYKNPLLQCDVGDVSLPHTWVLVACVTGNRPCRCKKVTGRPFVLGQVPLAWCFRLGPDWRHNSPEIVSPQSASRNAAAGPTEKPLLRQQRHLAAGGCRDWMAGGKIRSRAAFLEADFLRGLSARGT